LAVSSVLTSHAGGQGHDASDIGWAGQPTKVSHTIHVDMADSMRFTPDKIAVTQGETIRFVVKNSVQRKHEFVMDTVKALTSTGPYALLRHPQYLAFVLIPLGFLMQWSTLLTLLMFPILLVMYARLAITEEAEMRAQFGDAVERYATCTPRFFGTPVSSGRRALRSALHESAARVCVS